MRVFRPGYGQDRWTSSFSMKHMNKTQQAFSAYPNMNLMFPIAAVHP